MTEDRGPQIVSAVGSRWSAVFDAMATLRQQIVDLLMSREMDAREISAAVRVGEKEVYAHLAHISRSVSARGATFRIHSAACLSCGYVFRNRRRMTRPSRCPRCRHQRISLPRYFIET